MVQSGEIVETLDVLAIPTTAGSGSECTSFATVWDRQNSMKRSLDLPKLKPKYVLFSSSLLQSLPDNLLLYSALDARAHAVESLWSLDATNQSKNYAKKSIETSLNHLNVLSRNEKDLVRLLKSSKYAGQAINISRTSISHAISYPLTLQLGIPHGLAAALTLRKVWERFHSFYDLSDNLKKLVDLATLEIEQLKLTNEISKYANKEQILNVIPQIKLNSRFANFIVKPDESVIRDILIDSLNL
jgi:alcohol dehydrogenase class IV